MSSVGESGVLAHNEYANQKKFAFAEEGESSELPAFDGETTHGRLVTSDGRVIPLSSGERNPLYSKYRSAGHVEGKAAIWMRENDVMEAVLYHNNPNGTCNNCDRDAGVSVRFGRPGQPRNQRPKRKGENAARPSQFLTLGCRLRLLCRSLISRASLGGPRYGG